MPAAGADMVREANDQLDLSDTPGLPSLSESQSSENVRVDSEFSAGDDAEWRRMTAVTLTSETLALPDVRLDKVAIVQSALANGSYSIRASELASRVIDSMVDSSAEETPGAK